MPETRVEKSLFVLGVLAIAGLGFLIAHLWRHTNGVAAPPPNSQSVPARTSSGTGSTGTADTTATGAATGARTTTSVMTRSKTTTATPAAGTVSLLLTARASTWLQVRSGSSTGSILYSGTLAAGQTKVFRGRTVWARFGAAGNLSAQLDRKAFRLPSGTYDATFDGHGFRKAGG